MSKPISSKQRARARKLLNDAGTALESLRHEKNNLAGPVLEAVYVASQQIQIAHAELDDQQSA